MHSVGSLIVWSALSVLLRAQDPAVALGPSRAEVEDRWDSKQAAELAVRTKCLDQWIEKQLRVTAATQDPRKQWLRRLLLADPEALVVGGEVVVTDLRLNQRARAVWTGRLEPGRLAARWALAEEFLQHLGEPRAVIEVRVPANVDKAEARPLPADCGAVSLVKRQLQAVGLTIVDAAVAADLRRKASEREQLPATDAGFLLALRQQGAASILLFLGGETTGPHLGRNRGAVTTSWRACVLLDGVMASSGIMLAASSGTGTARDADEALSAAASVAVAQWIDSLFLKWSRAAFAGRPVVLGIDVVDAGRSKKPVLDALAVVGRSLSMSDPVVDRHRVDAVYTTSQSTNELAQLLRAELLRHGVQAELELADWDALRLRIGR